jgi:hypothetical protein
MPLAAANPHFGVRGRIAVDVQQVIDSRVAQPQNIGTHIHSFLEHHTIIPIITASQQRD